jgi:hypothetical protein
MNEKITAKLDEWHTDGADDRRDALIAALRRALGLIAFAKDHDGEYIETSLKAGERDIERILGV